MGRALFVFALLILEIVEPFSFGLQHTRATHSAPRVQKNLLTRSRCGYRQQYSLQSAPASVSDVQTFLEQPIGRSVRSDRVHADQLFTRALEIFQHVVAMGASAARQEQMIVGMRLLEEVFDLDFEVVLSTHYVDKVSSYRSLVNVTCMRPQGGHHDDSESHMDENLLGMALEPGRLCAGGSCCEACSRVLLSKIATEDECEELAMLSNALMPPNDGTEKQQNLQFHFSAAAGEVNLHLRWIRMIERLRRATAHEYGIPLPTLQLTQSFIARRHKQHPGPIHCDECSTASAFVLHVQNVLCKSD